jgi:hypothetical protein
MSSPPQSKFGTFANRVKLEHLIAAWTRRKPWPNCGLPARLLPASARPIGLGPFYTVFYIAMMVGPGWGLMVRHGRDRLRLRCRCGPRRSGDALRGRLPCARERAERSSGSLNSRILHFVVRANVGRKSGRRRCLRLCVKRLLITRPTECCRPIVTSGHFKRELDSAPNAVGHVIDVHRTA